MNTFEYLDFLRNEETIYQKFRSSREKLLAGGIMAHSLSGKGGYLVFLRHSTDIDSMVSAFSIQVNQHVPSILYDQSNTHTTVVDYDIRTNFSPNPKILKKLKESVREVLNSGRCSPLIIYAGWLANADTVIAAGIPNADFVNLQYAIKQKITVNGIDARSAWGAHITASRFKEPRNPEKTKLLLDFIQSAQPLGESRPSTVDIGYFNIADSFNLSTEERFIL